MWSDVLFDMLSDVQLEKRRHKLDDVEQKINSCLSDVRGDDVSDVADVVRKALTADDDTR